MDVVKELKYYQSNLDKLMDNNKRAFKIRLSILHMVSEKRLELSRHKTQHP